MTAAPILAADAFEAPASIIAFPLMAACAIALASIPTFYSLVGFIIFAIGVSIYGF